ncbi:hypothetical protein BD779DRAFT_781137 [Infundibulicybe gibba]|nr:hypothetical protein BD779DRAFT_781137 [Infundibulicybe gibba]
MRRLGSWRKARPSYGGRRRGCFVCRKSSGSCLNLLRARLKPLRRKQSSPGSYLDLMRPQAASSGIMLQQTQAKIFHAIQDLKLPSKPKPNTCPNTVDDGGSGSGTNSTTADPLNSADSSTTKTPIVMPTPPVPAYAEEPDAGAPNPQDSQDSIMPGNAGALAHAGEIDARTQNVLQTPAISSGKVLQPTQEELFFVHCRILDSHPSPSPIPSLIYKQTREDQVQIASPSRQPRRWSKTHPLSPPILPFPKSPPSYLRHFSRHMQPQSQQGPPTCGSCRT